MQEVMLRRYRSADQGFTLIEVMFALVFLTVGLLGIAALEDIALARNVDARRLTAATNVATEMLERIRSNAPFNSSLYSGPAVPFPDPNPALTPGVGFLYNGVVACTSSVTRGTPSLPGQPCAGGGPVAPCVAVPPGGLAPPGGRANGGNTGAPGLLNTTAVGDYNQWAQHLTDLDSGGASLLPNAVGTVNSMALGAVGPTGLGQVQVTVCIQWTAGVRTPSIVMSTIVAPL